MANLGSLTYDLVANTARFEKGLTRAQRIAQRRSRTIKRAFTTLGSVIGVALGGASLAAAKNAAAQLGAISDQADKLGLTTDALQELRFAAEQAGVKVTSFDVGFQRFTRRVADAAEGNKQLAKTFKDFNIELTDTEGRLKTNESVFMEFADAIAASDDQGQRILKTFQLFDTEGVDLVRILQQGSAAITEFRETARRMGAVIDEDVIRNADKADKELAAMSRVIDAQLKPALVEIAPLLVSAAGKIAAMTRAAAEFFRKIGLVSSTNPVQIYSDEIDKLQTKLERARKAQGPIVGGILSALGTSRTKINEDIEFYTNQIAVMERARQHFIDNPPQAIGGAGTLTGAGTPAGGGAASAAATRMSELKAEADALTESLRTPFEEASDAIDRYDMLLAEGVIDVNTWGRAVNDALEGAAQGFDVIEEKTEQAGKQMSVFAEQASRNMQDSFADFLFDPFEGGLDGMLKSFADTMRRMAAEAASARIFEAIGAQFAGTAIGNFFAAGSGGGTSAPIVEYQPRASGGALAAGQVALVGERGPELFVSGKGGTVIPNNALGGGMEVNIHNAPQGTTAEGRQGADGRPIIDLFLGEVASDITRNGIVGQAFDQSRRTRIAPVVR